MAPRFDTPISRDCGRDEDPGLWRSRLCGYNRSMSTTPFISPLDIAPSASDAAVRARLDEVDVNVLQPGRAAGLTGDTAVYSRNYAAYFAGLDRLDALLDARRYLAGETGPRADDEGLALLLWMHDAVFYPLYKLNRQRLEQFANLAHYMRDVFAVAGLAAKVDLDGLKRAAFLESEFINPKQRVPLGQVALDGPHDRALRFEPSAEESATEENPRKKAQAGEWKRRVSGHRHHISADGSSGFPAERGRYHLYVANNCPWCHRAILARSLKGLEDVITMDVLFYRRDPDRGWQFRPDEPRCTADSLFGYDTIREVYARVGSAETSVPVLWDRETETIVSNESAEIVRMFEQGFGAFSEGSATLYPQAQRAQIDRINAFTYHAINNGAYKAGFADSQSAYESAYHTFFAAIDRLDQMLRGRRFLLGDELTEADLRLFPTIFRFDAVYFTRFNLNQRMVRDVPSLQRWLDTMLAIPGIAGASDLDHCRRGYFGRTGNGIVPLGPA